MRRSVIAVAALLALTAPALADELSDARDFIKAAGLSGKADTLLWCGAAFTITAAMTDDAASKKSATDFADSLFTQAAALLAVKGIKTEDMGTFGQDYAVVVKSEIIDKLADPEHTQEECTTAASEA